MMWSTHPSLLQKKHQTSEIPRYCVSVHQGWGLGQDCVSASSLSQCGLFILGCREAVHLVLGSLGLSQREFTHT